MPMMWSSRDDTIRKGYQDPLLPPPPKLPPPPENPPELPDDERPDQPEPLDHPVPVLPLLLAIFLRDAFAPCRPAKKHFEQWKAKQIHAQRLEASIQSQDNHWKSRIERDKKSIQKPTAATRYKQTYAGEDAQYTENENTD